MWHHEPANSTKKEQKQGRMLLSDHKAREMGRIEADPWASDWELTGSPLCQRQLKPEPLWSYHASIETIKNSPRTKFSQDRLSSENSRFFTLETTIRGQLFSSNDIKRPVHVGGVGGDDHSLSAPLASPATNSLSFLSSKPLPVSPGPFPKSERRRKPNYPIDSPTSSVGVGNTREETKECAGDDTPRRQTSRNHEETISRYEKLRNERLKIRHKIAQRRVERQGALSSDLVVSQRRPTESLNGTLDTTQVTSPLDRERRSRDWSNDARSNAATRIQASVRRLLALKILTRKKAEKKEAAATRRLQEEHTSFKYSWNRPARTNDILEKIKARELHHVSYQLGHLYTIQEE